MDRAVRCATSQYWVDLPFVGAMLPPGLVGGAVGIWLACRLPKPAVQRLFAPFLICVGVYMTIK